MEYEHQSWNQFYTEHTMVGMFCAQFCRITLSSYVLNDFLRSSRGIFFNKQDIPEQLKPNNTLMQNNTSTLRTKRQHISKGTCCAQSGAVTNDQTCTLERRNNRYKDNNGQIVAREGNDLDEEH